ncbi:hypothetical protein H8D36_07495 [archaeon]|nr:hypothetical protein [archaeon]MBL7057638.1 hypothetical protein [Candidatus Woesearchaeota archaeon]
MDRHEHPIPPHALPVKNKNKVKFMLTSMIYSALFTVGFAFALFACTIPLNVIIPSSAPVWMGTLSLAYMMQIEK